MSEKRLVPIDLDRQIEPSAEIEFALVLSRIIDSVQNDPTEMRQAIYELARHKLREQFDGNDIDREADSHKALEAAIRGVEAFSYKNKQTAANIQLQPAATPVHDAPIPIHGEGAGWRVQLELGEPRKRRAAKLGWAIAAATVLLLGCALVLTQTLQRRRSPTAVAQSTPKAFATAPEIVRPAVPQRPSRPLPTAYGVYAVVGEQLFDLKPLPGRPPDIRVAISALITDPPKTVLPNGHPKFIVFRRDLAAERADKADIRIIAKISKTFGAPDDSSNTGNAWAIRNVSYPLRASPVPENSDMYELASEDSAADLPPGRYAVILKTVAYDFVVAGSPTDPRQCLERVVSTTGTFFSECPARR